MRLFICFRILVAVEAGLVQRWIKQFEAKDNSQCDRSTSQLGRGAGELKHSAGAFIALAIGLLCSSAAFALEIIFKLYQQSKQVLKNEGFLFI